MSDRDSIDLAHERDLLCGKVAELEAECERLRGLAREACDMATTAAAFLSPLYRQEFYRRDGARIAAIEKELER